MTTYPVNVSQTNQFPVALVHSDVVAMMRQGHAMDMAGTWILHIKSEVSDMI